MATHRRPTGTWPPVASPHSPRASPPDQPGRSRRSRSQADAARRQGRAGPAGDRLHALGAHWANRGPMPSPPSRPALTGALPGSPPPPAPARPLTKPRMVAACDARDASARDEGPYRYVQAGRYLRCGRAVGTAPGGPLARTDGLIRPAGARRRPWYMRGSRGGASGGPPAHTRLGMRSPAAEVWDRLRGSWGGRGAIMGKSRSYRVCGRPVRRFPTGHAAEAWSPGVRALPGIPPHGATAAPIGGRRCGARVVVPHASPLGGPPQSVGPRSGGAGPTPARRTAWATAGVPGRHRALARSARTARKV